MACRLDGAKPLSEPMLEYCWLDPWVNLSEILIEIYTFSFKKMHLKMSSENWRPFCPGLNVLSGLQYEAPQLTFYNDNWSSHVPVRCPNIQWNLSVTTTSIIKHITCDSFNNVFKWRLKVPIYSCLQYLPSGAYLGGPWPPRWTPEGREVSH